MIVVPQTCGNTIHHKNNIIQSAALIGTHVNSLGLTKYYSVLIQLYVTTSNCLLREVLKGPLPFYGNLFAIHLLNLSKFLTNRGITVLLYRIFFINAFSPPFYSSFNSHLKNQNSCIESQSSRIYDGLLCRLYGVTRREKIPNGRRIQGVV